MMSFEAMPLGIGPMTISVHTGGLQPHDPQVRKVARAMVEMCGSAAAHRLGAALSPLIGVTPNSLSFAAEMSDRAFSHYGGADRARPAENENTHDLTP
jgi:hypothetical protein